jgi:hypothetical protein
MTVASFWRVLRTGLSSLRDRAANLRCRLAALRFNPSRNRYARMARLPSTELVKKVSQFAVDHRFPDQLAVAELAMRWGYMHGQWDAREELLDK